MTSDLLAALTEWGGRPGVPIAVVIVPSAGLGIAIGANRLAFPSPFPEQTLRSLDLALRPRWVWWSAQPWAEGVRTCWDLGAVHRVLFGGRRDDPAAIWAACHGLPEPSLPERRSRWPQYGARDDTPDLFEMAERELVLPPVQKNNQLEDTWASRKWILEEGEDARAILGDAAKWAAMALEAQSLQWKGLEAVPDPRRVPRQPSLALLTAYAESAAALLAMELEQAGLPIDLEAAEKYIGGFVGPRPRNDVEALAARTQRDNDVLVHFKRGGELPKVDLRGPAQVKELLTRIGIDMPDTRSWRIEPFRDSHPGVAALLDWRKAERIATTYGYHWIDEHVGADNRLRGGWNASDGAAGRMTAGAGLHNLPAEFRVAVVAEPSHVFVRADLGQIEPRVLAAVSGDPAFVAAAQADDLYTPVAEQLGCDRPTAKVAVLAAMYGQTSGVAGEAFKRMKVAYPQAIAYLRAAEDAGRNGVDIRTWGGRLLRLRPREVVESPGELDEPVFDDAPPGSSAGAPVFKGRGRFARNAVIQGAAAEFFKAWAASVRIGLIPYGGHIVLCLHDELLVHVPSEHAEAAAVLVTRAVESTAGAWASGSGVRFVVDCSIVSRWSDAK